MVLVVSQTTYAIVLHPLAKCSDNDANVHPVARYLNKREIALNLKFLISTSSGNGKNIKLTGRCVTEALPCAFSAHFIVTSHLAKG